MGTPLAEFVAWLRGPRYWDHPKRTVRQCADLIEMLVRERDEAVAVAMAAYRELSQIQDPTWEEVLLLLPTAASVARLRRDVASIEENQ